MKNINYNSVNLQSFSKNDLSYNENELRSYLGVRSFDEFNKLSDVVIVNRMDEKVKELDATIDESYLTNNTYLIIKRGKKNYYVGKKN